jgi:hypothetical protein
MIMKHEFEHYDDEEKKEFLALASQLKHEWQWGDMGLWNPEAAFRIGRLFTIVNIEDDVLYVRYTDGAGGSFWDSQTKSRAWLPTLDDIIRSEGWNPDWRLNREIDENHTVGPDWEVGYRWGVTLGKAPHPCLAALRAIGRK